MELKRSKSLKQIHMGTSVPGRRMTRRIPGRKGEKPLRISELLPGGACLAHPVR
jgi:hypothetical protein